MSRSDSSRSNSRRSFLTTAGAAAAAAVIASGTSVQAAAPGVKIIGISCSQRKGKTTSAGLAIALDSAKAFSPEVEVELIELAGMKFDFTPAEGDDFSKIAPKLADPRVGGIILGSPVYNGGVTGLGRCFLDRWSFFRKTFALRDKVGGALSVSGGRNTGVELVLFQLIATMMAQDMIIVGDGKPTAHFGGALWNDKDSIEKDEVGIKTAKGLGARVAEVALRLARAKA